MRDTIVRLAPLYHSATKIGIDAAALFLEAASFWGGRAGQIIAAFPLRNPEDRSLESMGYSESANEGGFIYGRKPSP